MSRSGVRQVSGSVEQGRQRPAQSAQRRQRPWGDAVLAGARAASGLVLLGAMQVSPVCAAEGAAPASAPAVGKTRPALTVNTVLPQPAQWPLKLAATGSVAAWQEAVIGADGAGGRLVEVLAQVGDRVQRGQLLARLVPENIEADLAQSRAGVAEAEAVLAEAKVNAGRLRELRASGMASAQQADQAILAEQTAQARLASAQARVKGDELRLAQTRILAPDEGVISARGAVIGGFAGTGQELFRLIRRGRLEWRAELPSADLARIRPGLAASLSTPAGQTVAGTVRQVAPTVDAQSRNGLVYVDLSASPADLRPGMFARGEFSFGQAAALSLPQSAVLMRDGFAQVFKLGADQRVVLTKVSVGRREGGRVEITRGLAVGTPVVLAGGAFLADGDRVQVVNEVAAGAAASAASR